MDLPVWWRGVSRWVASRSSSAFRCPYSHKLNARLRLQIKKRERERVGESMIWKTEVNQKGHRGSPFWSVRAFLPRRALPPSLLHSSLTLEFAIHLQRFVSLA